MKRSGKSREREKLICDMGLMICQPNPQKVPGLQRPECTKKAMPWNFHISQSLNVGHHGKWISSGKCSCSSLPLGQYLKGLIPEGCLLTALVALMVVNSSLEKHLSRTSPSPPHWYKVLRSEECHVWGVEGKVMWEEVMGKRKSIVLPMLNWNGYLIWKLESESSCCGSVVTNVTSNHEDAGLIPGLTQWVKDQVLPQAVA